MRTKRREDYLSEEEGARGARGVGEAESRQWVHVDQLDELADGFDLLRPLHIDAGADSPSRLPHH